MFTLRPSAQITPTAQVVAVHVGEETIAIADAHIVDNVCVAEPISKLPAAADDACDFDAIKTHIAAEMQKYKDTRTDTIKLCTHLMTQVISHALTNFDHGNLVNDMLWVSTFKVAQFTHSSVDHFDHHALSKHVAKFGMKFQYCEGKSDVPLCETKKVKFRDSKTFDSYFVHHVNLTPTPTNITAEWLADRHVLCFDFTAMTVTMHV